MLGSKPDVEWVTNNVWCMAGIPLNLKLWSPMFNAKREVVDKDIIWVRLPSFPMEYWTEGRFRMLGNFLGEYVVDNGVHHGLDGS